MARHKKHKKTHRRRHRVGALSMSAGSPVVMIGSVALGYLAGSAVNNAINMLIPASMKTAPSTGKIVAGAQLGLGALLVLGKGKKSLMKTIAGGLLAGAGIKRATVVFAPNTTDTLGAYATPGQLSGYGDVPVIGRRRVAGYGDVPVIGSYNAASSLTGAQKVVGSLNSRGDDGCYTG